MKNAGANDPLEEAAMWFFRRDGGSLPSADEARFRMWLAAAEENRAAYAEISGTWQELAKIPEPACPPKSVWRRTAMPVAAAFVCLCILSAGNWYFDLSTRIGADSYTATGELKLLALPDGSTAEMNSDTAITLSYSPNERRIRLIKGEAVFTVSPDAQRPFIVEARGGEAKALGTVYGVRENADDVTVTVIESHVAISAASGSPSVHLGADQRVHYRDGQLGVIEAVDAASETAWRRRKLIFVDKPLGEVVDELNRYHSGVIRIVDGSIRSRRISGVFETGDIAKVVDALENSFGFSDTRLGNLVILIHR
ncbi:FecR family protein [Agrobacterium sp. T29]|uniref:FecR family protein n=1 Tax=Agrobacterium sp. T29 TaxID=2580515 RepID=UPI00143DAB20|nr:FecR family protein [Agrobacterium sp. T29]